MRSLKDFLCLGIFLVSAAGLTGCAADVTPDSNPADDDDATESTEAALTLKKTVKMTPMAFKSAKATVKVGATVTWKNTSPVTHTVTSGASSSPSDQPGALFDAVVAPGKTFVFKFTSPGTFPYFCRPHESMGMTGTITVKP